MQSKTLNHELKAQARAALQGHWRTALCVALTFALLPMIRILPVIGGPALFLIYGPMLLGLSRQSISLARGQAAPYHMLFSGFSQFTTGLGIFFIQWLPFLLISVGLVLSARAPLTQSTLLLLSFAPIAILRYSWSMAFYIAVDHSTYSSWGALSASWNLMRGNRWKLFCLELRFIGLILLSILTLGLGLLWLWPYIQVSQAKFYQDVCQQPER